VQLLDHRQRAVDVVTALQPAPGDHLVAERDATARNDAMSGLLRAEPARAAPSLLGAARTRASARDG